MSSTGRSARRGCHCCFQGMKQKLPKKESGKSASPLRIIPERPFNTMINVALSLNDAKR